MQKKREKIDIATDPNIIANDVQEALYGKDTTKVRIAAKLFTFILLFIAYIFLVIYIENFGIRMIVMFGGLILLLVILQLSVIPSFRKKEKKLLEP